MLDLKLALDHLSFVTVSLTRALHEIEVQGEIKPKDRHPIGNLHTGAIVDRWISHTEHCPLMVLQVMPGLLLGGLLPFVFSGFTMLAVGRAAGAVIEEVTSRSMLPLCSSRPTDWHGRGGKI